MTKSLVVLSVAISFLSTALALSGVNVVVPAIALYFKLDVIETNWILVVFVVMNISLLLPAGRLADNYGRKKIYLFGALILTLGGLISSVSFNYFLFLLGRALQGVGSAFIFSSGLALVVSIVSQKERGFYIGIVTACVYVGLSIGPLIGGYLNEIWGWRSIFMTLCLFNILTIFVYFISKSLDWKADERLPIDISGSLLLFFTVLCLSLGTTFIYSDYAIVLITLSVVFALLFFRLQVRRTSPLINIQLLRKNRPLFKSFISSCLIYTSNFPLLFLIALYLQYVFSMSAFETGVFLMWHTVFMTLSSIIAGQSLKFIHPKYLSLTGAITFSIGLLILAMSLEIREIFWIGLSLSIVGLGFGQYSSPNSTMGLSQVAPNRIGIASGLINFARMVGNMLGSIIIVLLTAILLGQVKISELENFDDFILMSQSSLIIGAIFAIWAGFIVFSQKKG